MNDVSKRDSQIVVVHHIDWKPVRFIMIGNLELRIGLICIEGKGVMEDM